MHTAQSTLHFSITPTDCTMHCTAHHCTGGLTAYLANDASELSLAALAGAAPSGVCSWRDWRCTRPGVQLEWQEVHQLECAPPDLAGRQKVPHLGVQLLD